MYIVDYDYGNYSHSERTYEGTDIAEAIVMFNSTCLMVQDDIKEGCNYTDCVTLYSALCEVDDDGFIDDIIEFVSDIQENDYTSFVTTVNNPFVGEEN
jgi:hypothetical protein